MTDKEPTPNTGETLEELLEGVIFADPGTHRLREEWEATKREVQELFVKASREQYEERLDHHQTCQAPNAEELARAEASALRILLIEERDRRLAQIWATILRRVETVLAEKNAEKDDSEAHDR